ncbi:MAG: ECF transporter S component [Candidatus Bathyarchaeota archaeon]|nr:ECF transporter S component [Candidatus Bathyarchaeota archaeon]
MGQAKLLAFAALMAALSNILSIVPFAIPISAGPFPSQIHFTQLPIFISGFLAGPWAGLLTGAVGGLYMSFTMIPFIIGGLALLGVSTGLFAKKLRPSFSAILAWCVQAPYVFLTDYIWFIRFMPSSVALTTITTILIKLTVEAVIASVMVEILIPYIKRAGLTFK